MFIRKTLILTVVWVAALAALAASWRLIDDVARTEVATTRAEVLGSAQSLSDMVANTYERPEENRNKVAKVVKVAASTKKQSKPAPRSFGDGYKTVCVRLCDGFYFPVSASVGRDRLETDEATCQRSCSSPAKLYYYRNRDGSPETMTDREGHPYLGLMTAFLHRVTYDPACTCKATPWSEEANAEHRVYALEGDKAKGAAIDEAALARLKEKVADSKLQARILSGAAAIAIAGEDRSRANEQARTQSRTAERRAAAKPRQSPQERVSSAPRSAKPQRAIETRATNRSIGRAQPVRVRMQPIARIRVSEYRGLIKFPN